MRTILITGGAGFIGSHLADALLQERDIRVVCFDNLSTGSEKNINHLSSDQRFTFIKGDLTNASDFLFRDMHFDEIYNLACPASPVHYQADPIGTIRVNTIGMMNALELAKKDGARILQASTSEIYGDPLVHPQKEDYWGNVNSMGPRSCYDEGKRIAEALCYEYRKTHHVDVRVARIFNTYGPRMAENDGRVVSNFIVQALKGSDITIEGEGIQTRSFCYVSDLVRGLIALMASRFLDPINLGNPDERTVLQLADKIIALTHSGSKLVFTPPAQDGPSRRKPDISRAKKELSWEPTISLDDGLARTIEDFKKRI